MTDTLQERLREFIKDQGKGNVISPFPPTQGRTVFRSYVVKHSELAELSDALDAKDAENALLRDVVQNAIDHHRAALAVVRGNLDDGYAVMAEEMRIACDRWCDALRDS